MSWPVTAEPPPVIAGTLTAIAGPIVVTRNRMRKGSLTVLRATRAIRGLLWNMASTITGLRQQQRSVGDYISDNRISQYRLGRGANRHWRPLYLFLHRRQETKHLGRVAGLTYNFRDPDTQYNRSASISPPSTGSQSQLPPHQHLFSRIAVRLPANQTDDSGQNPILGGFRSPRFGVVVSAIGYRVPVGAMQGSKKGEKTYLGDTSEFRVQHRPSGMEYLACTSPIPRPRLPRSCRTKPLVVKHLVPTDLRLRSAAMFNGVSTTYDPKFDFALSPQADSSRTSCQCPVRSQQAEVGQASYRQNFGTAWPVRRLAVWADGQLGLANEPPRSRRLNAHREPSFWQLVCGHRYDAIFSRGLEPV